MTIIILLADDLNNIINKIVKSSNINDKDGEDDKDGKSVVSSLVGVIRGHHEDHSLTMEMFGIVEKMIFVKMILVVYGLIIVDNEGFNHETGSALLNDSKLKVKMNYVGINVIMDGTFESNMTLILDRDEIISMAFPNAIELTCPQREYCQ